MEITGEFKIKDRNEALRKIQDKSRLLQCVPGVTKVEGDSFVAITALGPIKAEIQGRITEFMCKDNTCRSKVVIKAPGIDTSIDTSITVAESALWKASVEVTGPMAKFAQKLAEEKMKEISNQLISCVLG